MTVNPRQSFKLKLCIRVFLVSALTFFTVIAASIYFVRQEVRADLDALVDAKLNYALRALDEGLSTTQVSAENLAGICNSPLVSNRSDSIYSLCEHFLNFNPRIQGVCIGYEPNVVAGHEEGFSPYIMRTDSGFIRRDLAETKDYRESNWYKVAHDTGVPYWSKPFEESNGTLITSYNIPLKDKNGKVYSVVAVDLNLNVMNDSLQMLKPYPSAMLTVVDEDGTFIAHPNRDYIMKQSLESVIATATYAPNHEIIDDIKAHKRGWGEYETENDRYYVYYAPVEANGWTVTLEVPLSEVAGGYHKMFNTILIVMVLGIVLLILVSLVVIHRLTKPLESFAAAAKDISHGNFHVKLPVINDHNELYDLRQALVSMELSLDKHIEELAAASASKATMESELNVARKIQMAMVPKTYPDREDVDVFASITPAKAVGGDLYDFMLDGDDLFFCIGDVSGKGVPAALVMAITRALFRISAVHLSRPAEIASTINNTLAENNSESMFVTMFIGKCNLKTGEFTCCNCGHNPPATNGRIKDMSKLIVEPCDEAAFMQHVPTNLPIGVIEGFDYKEITMTVTPGVSIFLYTDGVTEAENKKKELFGEQRLLDRLCEIGKKGSARQIVNYVSDDVHRHARTVDQSDDITMLCFKYKVKDV
ncbi:MAG: SpoIIE family protein phosphatase [Prevotellaceae bacterium]|nr:SpoIIE family protein phosphatase [Prevotellaceae bacterium]